MQLSKRDELRKLLSLAAPSAIVSGLRTSQALTDQAIVGHLQLHHSSAFYLDAVALALLWMQLTISTAVRGIGGAVNVLSSQAIGAGNHRLSEIWLQLAALVIGPFVCLIVAGLWLLTSDVVHLFAANQTMGEVPGSANASAAVHDDPVEYAGLYARLSIGYILPTIWMECLNNWLLAQRIIIPQLIVYAIACVTNLLLNLALVVYGVPILGIEACGFVCSPVATTVTRWLQLLALLVALPACKLRLPRIRLCEAVRTSRMRTFALQMVPRSLSAILEEAALQTIGALAGRLGEVPTATHNAMLMAFFWLTAPMYGVGTAVTQRMGYFLGAGLHEAARAVAVLAYQLCIVVSWTIALTLILTRNEIGRIFTPDGAVDRMVAAITPLVGGAYCLIGIFYASMAVLGGQGRPQPVAIAFLLGSFIISPSLGYVLTFVVGCCGGVRLYGLWLGLIGGYCVTTLISLLAVCVSDWVAIAKVAQERSEVTPGSQQTLAPTDSSVSTDSDREECAAGQVPPQAAPTQALPPSRAIERCPADCTTCVQRSQISSAPSDVQGMRVPLLPSS